MILLTKYAVVISVISKIMCMSVPKKADMQEISPMGRPFKLGMLYDARTEKIVSGVTFWDDSFIEQYVKPMQQRFSQGDIITEDNLKRKFKEMDISAEMQLSFFAGLVKASGSAKYLDDSKTSAHQARMTFKYSSTTKYESLTMKVLGDVKYSHVYDLDIATHVVTGILYGGNAIFIFDRELTEDEDRLKVEGSMQVSIDKFPKLSVSGQASLSIDEEERKKTEKFKCSFYGDFIADKNPSDFEEAVRLYQNISKLIEGNYGGKPVKVYLYPINKLLGKESIILRDISNQIINQVEGNMEDLQMYIIRSNDLLREHVCKYFPKICEQISEFNRMISYYKIEFQKDLSEVLPKIRGAGGEEVELINILQKRESSPFNHNAVTNWIEGKTHEIKLLKTYIRVITKESINVNIAYKSSDLDTMIYSPSQPAIVVLILELRGENDEYISKIKNFLGVPNYWKNKSSTNVTWYKSADIKININEVVNQFKDLSLININDNSPKLVFAYKILDSKSEFGPRASMKIYNKGKLVHDDFELPSSPRDPKALIKGPNTIAVEWKTPAIGSKFVKEYYIQYKKIPSNHDENTEYIHATETTCIINVEPTSTYEIKIAAVSDLNIHGNGTTLIYNPPKKKECRKPFQRIGDSCLFAKADKQESWEASRSTCKRMNSDLAILTDVSMFGETIKYIQRTINKDLTVWIGGSDMRQEDVWKWVNGTPMPRNAPYWGRDFHVSGCPIEPSGGYGQNCVFMYALDRYYLHDAPCSEERVPLCQYFVD